MVVIYAVNRKQAAVGRREMQILFAWYIIVSLCDIFTTGGFHASEKVLLAFSAVHLAAITAMAWVLFLTAMVSYQLMRDGSATSISLVLGSSLVIFVGTMYIALDTGLRWTGYFEKSRYELHHNNIGLYVLYLGLPLVGVVAYTSIQIDLLCRVLNEKSNLGEF